MNLPSQHTPVKRRAPRKRKDGRSMCIWSKCRRARYDGAKLCAKHEADRLFSLYIRDRDGECVGHTFVPEVACKGELQCMHLVSRGYLAVRWDPQNALAGCAAHHMFLTEHPVHHEQFCREAIGTKTWEALRQAALTGERQHPADVIAEFGGAA